MKTKTKEKIRLSNGVGTFNKTIYIDELGNKYIYVQRSFITLEYALKHYTVTK